MHCHSSRSFCEEEAAAGASTIGLPDLDYDSAVESDCESDHDLW